MSHLLRRPAVVASLGVAVVLGLAGVALAGGGKPAKPPAKGPPGMADKPEPAAPVATGEFLAEVEWILEDQEKEADKAQKQRRYDALLGYVQSHGSAKDIEDARFSLVQTADNLEDAAKVVTHADEFLAAHGDTPRALFVRWWRTQSLSNLDRAEDAKKAWDEVVKDSTFGQQDPRFQWGVWSEYGGYLASLDDVAGARKVFETAKEELHLLAKAAEQEILELDLIGKEATAFPESAKDMDGKPVTLADYKGKILLIDFWATWCGPCRGEMPNVIETYAKFHDKGFEVLGVSMDRKDQAARVRKYVTLKKMPWRQVYYADGENAVATEYGVEGIPHTVLVDRDGKILRQGLRGAALTRTVANLLAKK